MKQTFADSFFYLAVLNPRDSAHSFAVETGEKLVGKIVTTEWVLLEVADALCSADHRQRFVDLLDEVENDSRHLVVRSSERLFQLGLDLYRQRSDKNWSLTDCISFATMQEQGLTEARTADQHFRQAGFMALLTPHQE